MSQKEIAQVSAYKLSPERLDGQLVIKAVGQDQPLIEITLGQFGVGGDGVVEVAQVAQQGANFRLGLIIRRDCRRWV
jgi:hypothetical protein